MTTHPPLFNNVAVATDDDFNSSKKVRIPVPLPLHASWISDPLSFPPPPPAAVPAVLGQRELLAHSKPGSVKAGLSLGQK